MVSGQQQQRRRRQCPQALQQQHRQRQRQRSNNAVLLVAVAGAACLLLLSFAVPNAEAFAPSSSSFGAVQRSSAARAIPAFQKSPPSSSTSSSRTPASCGGRPSPSAFGSSTSLRMASPQGFALAAITGAITGGFFSGGLHAIAGTCFFVAIVL